MRNCCRPGGDGWPFSDIVASEIYPSNRWVLTITYLLSGIIFIYCIVLNKQCVYIYIYIYIFTISKYTILYDICVCLLAAYKY